MQQLECTEHHSAVAGTDGWAKAPAAAGRGTGKLVHNTANQRSWDHLCKNLLKTLVGLGMAGQDVAACLTRPSEKTDSSDIARERQRLRTGGAVKPRKMYLAFQFIQDSKLSSVSAAGCLEVMNVSRGSWVCRAPGAAPRASQLMRRQAAVGTGPGCWWAKQPSQPGASFQASLRPHFK